MKEIIAIVRIDAVHRVLRALHDCEHFPGVTIASCEGQSRGKGPGGRYVPSEDTLDFRAVRVMTVLCSDTSCEHLVTIIQKSAHTGQPGDGVIVVKDVERVVRIRSGAEQEDAV